MVFGIYQVIITPGKIIYESDINNNPSGDGHPVFQIKVEPIQVKPKDESKDESGPTIFFVLPQNKDTIIIAIPNKETLCPFFVNRQPQPGEENEGWNNFSYPPAAIAYFQSQKPCTNLEEFLFFLRDQQNNPVSYQPVILNFGPNSDMAEILSHCQSMYFSKN